MRRLLLLVLVFALRTAHADTIYYSSPPALEDGRSDFGLTLLQLALARAGSTHRAELSPVFRQQNRAIAELVGNTGTIQVLGTMTSIEREEQLLPVRIPISKGLIGWRILLVNDHQRDALRDVRDLAGLRHVHMAVGEHWPDLDIMRSNGLAPDPVASYGRLFSMLKAHRIDAVPRSVMEIWSELKEFPELAAEPYLLLRYPAADYFFVSRANPELAEEIRRGLEIAQADGSFDRLLLAYYGKLLAGANLAQRRVIELSNPTLPPLTPIARKELWLTLDDLLKR